MKKILIAILACTFILSSCSNTGEVSSQSSQSSQSSSSESSSNDLTVSQLPVLDGNSSDPGTAPTADLRPMVADAAMYRGTISDITDTSFTLAQANGRNFGAATMKFTIDENTKFSVEKDKIKAGMYMEVYYGAPMGKAPDYTATQGAIQVNVIADEVNMCIYNGEVIGIEYKEGSKTEGQILMKPLDKEGETIFLFGENTQFYMNKDDIKAGAKLHILRSGVETRSLPPQTQAYEISVFEELNIK